MVIVEIYYYEANEPFRGLADVRFYTTSENPNGKLHVDYAGCSTIPPEFKK